MPLNRHGKTGQNFLTRPDSTRPEPDFFDPKQKRVDPWPDPCFVRVNPTQPTTRPELEPFFWGKKNSEIKTILVLLFIMSFKETIDTFT